MTPISPIRATLQAEGAFIALACLTAFHALEGSWMLFVVLVLAPDLFMLGYLGGARLGAICYNMAHSYVTPLVLAAIGLWAGSDVALQIALIWGAHIAADRAIGYGLKYARGFKATHLERV